MDGEFLGSRERHLNPLANARGSDRSQRRCTRRALSATPEGRGEPKIALATVDCDLYESAVPVFDFIEPLLQAGSVIYIDDLFVGNRGDPRKGVARAFLEYRKHSPWRFVRHLDVGWWGRSYIACRMDDERDDPL